MLANNSNTGIEARIIEKLESLNLATESLKNLLCAKADDSSIEAIISCLDGSVDLTSFLTSQEVEEEFVDWAESNGWIPLDQEAISKLMILNQEVDAADKENLQGAVCSSVINKYCEGLITLPPGKCVTFFSPT